MKDHEAEGYILSSCLEKEHCLEYCLAELQHVMFDNLNNGLIFRCYADIVKSGSIVNAHTLNSHVAFNNIQLPNDYLLDICRHPYCTRDYLPYYIDRLQEAYRKRVIHQCCSSALLEIKQSKSEVIIDELVDKVCGIDKRDKKKSRTIHEIIAECWGYPTIDEYLEAKVNAFKSGKPMFDGFRSGYKLLDQKIGCFMNGGLYLIGARTHTGKTTFSLSLLHNLLTAEKECNPLYFSMEMNDDEIAARMIAIEANVCHTKLKDGNLTEIDVRNIAYACKKIESQKNYYIENTCNPTISQVQSKIKRYVKYHGVNLIIIDYLTKIKGNGGYGSKHLEVDSVSKGLQSIALELNVPVICLAQLNRESTKRQNPRPTMTDFRESGSIEEDADCVILLHRPDLYNSQDKPGVTEVTIVKNRLMSRYGRIEYQLQYGKFQELQEVSQVIKEANESNSAQAFDDMLGF